MQACASARDAPPAFDNVARSALFRRLPLPGKGRDLLTAFFYGAPRRWFELQILNRNITLKQNTGSDWN
jgi:hypothetical protein